MTIKKDFSFYDLKDVCWSGAEKTLEIISNNEKEDEFMEFIEEYFQSMEETPNITEVNDFLWFEDEYIFQNLGIEEDE